MEPLKRLYWIRVGLGVIAAMICTAYNVFVGADEGFNVFLTGFVFALLFYLLSFYALKPHFIEKAKKPSEVLTTGIGIYFLMWLIFWTLSFSLVIPVHDIAVVDVNPSSINVDEAALFNITVVVKNEGDFAETFNVTAYYDETTIETQTVINLVPKNETTLKFTWNAEGVEAGNYTMRAEASLVSGEKDEEDNIFPR